MTGIIIWLIVGILTFVLPKEVTKLEYGICWGTFMAHMILDQFC
jgi:hypothetical protein